MNKAFYWWAALMLSLSVWALALWAVLQVV